jgi:hypothetical protein
MELAPVRFIGEGIEVSFDQPPALEKDPDCPAGFVWRGETFRVCEKLGEWRDNARRGRMARNMSERHLTGASIRGSWGVGRVYYRVRTEGGRAFDLYYDRAPTGSGGRKGSWFLYRELSGVEAPQ